MASKTHAGRRCPSCGANGSISESFCRFCGTLPGDALECEHHPGRAAEVACIICGMPLCRSCRSLRGALCADPEHSAIALGWDRLFASNSEFEADCVVQNLKDRGIVARAFSSRGFASAGPTDASDAVRVYVAKEDLARAEQCVADLTGPLGDDLDTIVEGM